MTKLLPQVWWLLWDTVYNIIIVSALSTLPCCILQTTIRPTCGRWVEKETVYSCHTFSKYWLILTKFCMISGGIRDMLICVNFGVDKSRGFGLCGGSNFGIYHWNGKYTLATVLRSAQPVILCTARSADVNTVYCIYFVVIFLYHSCVLDLELIPYGYLLCSCSSCPERSLKNSVVSNPNRTTFGNSLFIL